MHTNAHLSLIWILLVWNMSNRHLQNIF